VAITVHIHSNNGQVKEIPDGMEDPSKDNDQQLSLEEFDTLADELADKFMEFVGPDVKPLSDYAISREGIYEDHPKL
jgi:hypothetical protein